MAPGKSLFLFFIVPFFICCFFCYLFFIVPYLLLVLFIFCFSQKNTIKQKKNNRIGKKHAIEQKKTCIAIKNCTIDQGKKKAKGTKQYYKNNEKELNTMTKRNGELFFHHAL